MLPAFPGEKEEDAPYPRVLIWSARLVPAVPTSFGDL